MSAENQQQDQPEHQQLTREEILANRIARKQAKLDARKHKSNHSSKNDSTRRVHLKCKIKSLASEAKIIRDEEECNLKNHNIFVTLYKHRKYRLRSEARHALLAYGFLNGLEYRQIETKTPTTEPDWGYIEKLVFKFGVSKETKPEFTEYELACAIKEQTEKFVEWLFSAKRRFEDRY